MRIVMDEIWLLIEIKRTHEAVGFVRPGGLTHQVLSRQNIIEENLNTSDVLVIMCGTNDVAVNKAEEVLDGIEKQLLSH